MPQNAQPEPMDSLPALLSRHAHQIWKGTAARPIGPYISTGFRQLDAVLGAGWPVGTLVEIMTLGGGLGRSTLLLPALATLTKAGKAIAWLPDQEAPYAPTLHQAGVQLRRVFITESADHHQRLWAAETCLRHGGCGAVVLTESQLIADPLLRRLKLAAAAGGSIAFVLRTEKAADTPSPASVRIRVRSAPHSPHRYVTVLKCASHPPRTITLDLDAPGN